MEKFYLKNNIKIIINSHNRGHNKWKKKQREKKKKLFHNSAIKCHQRLNERTKETNERFMKKQKKQKQCISRTFLLNFNKIYFKHRYAMLWKQTNNLTERNGMFAFLYVLVEEIAFWKFYVMFTSFFYFFFCFLFLVSTFPVYFIGLAQLSGVINKSCLVAPFQVRNSNRNELERRPRKMHKYK